jgi:hypothetical protein
MGTTRLVAPRGAPDPGAAVAESAVDPAAPSEARLLFLDARGRPRGRTRKVRVEPQRLEAPVPGGALTRVTADPVLALSARVPEGAIGFRLDEPGRFPVFAALESAIRIQPRRPDRRTRIGAAKPKFLLAVLAERYAEPAPFLADCAHLLAAIEAIEPFASMKGRLAMEALFWRTDPARGQLGPLVEATDTDLIYGDRQLAADFLGKAKVKADLGLVLVNHNRRGGAGGNSRFPAWVTNRDSATDRWPAVAIHELGHALGLGDEYDSENANAAPGLEPNICRDPDPRRAPWAHLVTHAAPIPTLPAGASPRGLPANAVGTFEGARYRRTGLYRAQATCMMRTTGAPFCARCQELIRARLA